MDAAKWFENKPRKVALLGLGVSRLAYGDARISSNLTMEWDEVWTVNMGMTVYKHDKLFVMDDLRDQASKYPAYGLKLKTHDKPIITSTPYPEFPMAVRYPIEQIIKAVGDDLFNNTVVYAIASAMCTGVKDLYLYGCDFTYPNLTIREEGAQAAAYLLGMGRHFGMQHWIPQTSTLMAAYTVKGKTQATMHRPLYGYKKHPLYPEEDESDAIGLTGSTEIRAGQGDTSNAADGNKPHNQIVPGDEPSVIHPGGTGVGRRRRRNRKPAGLVLGTGGKNDTASPQGGGVEVAERTGGATRGGGTDGDKTIPPGR